MRFQTTNVQQSYFRAMLSLGASKPWPIAMEAMTGQKTMDPSAFLEYFKPLEDWLIQKNKDLGVNVGWIKSDSTIQKLSGQLSRKFIKFLIFHFRIFLPIIFDPK